MHVKMRRMQDQRGTGFSLLELMVAVGLASMVLLSLSFITQAMFTAKRDVETYDSEKDVFRGEYLIRSLFSTAVDVQNRSTAGPASGARGWVNTSFSAVDGAEVQPVAVFRRETRAFPMPPSAPGVAVANQSLHVNSGLFYIPPRFQDGIYTSGVLFADYGREATPDAPVSPGYEDEVIGNLVRFVTSDAQFVRSDEHPDGYEALKSFQVELMFRRFVTQSMSRPKCFLSTAGACPYSPSDGNDQNDTELYRDVRRFFKVLILNADSGPSPFSVNPLVRERTLGRIYFFRMISPLYGNASDANL